MKTARDPVLAVLLVLFVLAARGDAAQPKLQKYGARVAAPVGETVSFPDFQLRYLGRRGGSMGLVFFDYEITGGPAKAIVHWGGTGNIAPQAFCFLGRQYELERDASDKLGRLNGDEVVVWQGEKAAACRFRLTVLAKNWHDLELGYDYAQAWPRLRESAFKDRPLQYIEAADVETYDWPAQAITLTPYATRRLLGTARAEAQSRNPSAAIPEDADPMALLALKGFLVEAEGEPLYGGVFLQPESAMAIRYPRMTAELVADRAVLRLAQGEADLKSIADRRIEALFRELGKLRVETPKK